MLAVILPSAWQVIVMTSAPRLPIGHPERIFDCEMALEEEFRALADRAETAGWSRGEVATALQSLAENILFHEVVDGEQGATTVSAETSARNTARLADAAKLSALPLA